MLFNDGDFFVFIGYSNVNQDKYCGKLKNIHIDLGCLRCLFHSFSLPPYWHLKEQCCISNT